MSTVEHFDVLDAEGKLTGQTRPRKEVHELGLFHRAVHVWLWAPSTGELMLQLRAPIKDSWPGRWDISSAGHISAGETSLPTAVRELEEELGLSFPLERFEFLFTHLEKQASTQRGRPFINNEFNDVYLLTLSAEERSALDPAAAPPPFKLQEEEVSAVCWKPLAEVKRMYVEGDPSVVPCSDFASYGRLFDTLEARLAAAPATAAASAPTDAAATSAAT